MLMQRPKALEAAPLFLLELFIRTIFVAESFRMVQAITGEINCRQRTLQHLSSREPQTQQS